MQTKTDAGLVRGMLWTGTDGGVLSGVLVFLQCGWYMPDSAGACADEAKIGGIILPAEAYIVAYYWLRSDPSGGFV